MPPQCSSAQFGFARVEGRAVVASFDGGAITSDAGGVLRHRAAGDLAGGKDRREQRDGGKRQEDAERGAGSVGHGAWASRTSVPRFCSRGAVRRKEATGEADVSARRSDSAGVDARYLPPAP